MIFPIVTVATNHMTEQHPITPPPWELVEKWMAEIWHEGTPVQISASDVHIATRAAQWGANIELEACCTELDRRHNSFVSRELREVRRPKPLSLKQQALETFAEMQIEPCIVNGVDTNAALRAKYNIIRRALEALDD